MLIDVSSCIGCKACMTACKANHAIPFGEHMGHEYYRIHPLEVEKGQYPYVIRNMTPILCMQCEEAPCTEVCPISGALYRRPDGVILVDGQKCTGCKQCVAVCPYDAIYYCDDREVVDKCDFCVENIDQGSQPECVAACPCDAMVVGDVDDAESEISLLINELDARPLGLETQTRLSVYYTRHAARLKGTVREKHSGIPIAGVAVRITCLGEGITETTRTDSGGVFFFWSLKADLRYVLTIEDDCCAPISMDVDLQSEYLDIGSISVMKR